MNRGFFLALSLTFEMAMGASWPQVGPNYVPPKARVRTKLARQRRIPMCPACISTTALLLGGFVSTGGLAGLLARLPFKRHSKKHSGG